MFLTGSRSRQRVHYLASQQARPSIAPPQVRPFIFLAQCNIDSSRCVSIASSLAPEDPEIAFNLAAVLEACTCICYPYCSSLTLHQQVVG